MAGWHRIRIIPFVLLLLLAACATRPERPLDPVANLEGLRSTALSLVNDERRAQGISPLRMSATLDAAAQAHAEDMARRDFYGHRSPEGRDVADRYHANGGGEWAVIAENISSCIACKAPESELREFHAGWMQSPGHRRNILDPRVDRFGFGIASGGGRLYAVQTFVKEREGYALAPFAPAAR